MVSNSSVQLRLRTALLVALLIPLNAVFQMQPGLAHMSMISLLYNAVMILFLLAAFSRLIEKFLPKLALSRAELLSLYVAACLSTAIGGHMCVQIMISVISYAFAFATPENDWQALFWNYIPEWVSVRDKGALDNLYRWDSTLYLEPHIRAYLHFAYQGEINTGWAGEEAFQRLEGWLTHPSETDVPVIAAIGAGFLVSVALTLMRGQFLWMPLHAAGYAVTTMWTMNFFWFSIFVSFVLKWVIVKHGGLRSFRRAAPFFLGLVLGEFVVTTFWGVVRIVTGQSTYITIDM